MQVSLKKPRGRRFTEEFKVKCLTMYFMSPKLYKNYLVKTFCFPGPPTLRSYRSNTKLLPGFNENVFQSLQLKTQNFKTDDKMALCIDEMSIKTSLSYHFGQHSVIGFEDFGDEKSFTPALNATVIMVKGLFNNWKQALTYYFVNFTCPARKLKYLLEQLICALQHIGLNVCAVTSDMGSNNVELTN